MKDKETKNLEKMLPVKGCPGCALLIDAINKFFEAEDRSTDVAGEEGKWERAFAKERRAKKNLIKVMGGIEFFEEIRN